VIRTDSIDDAFRRFVDGCLDVLAGLRPRLLKDVEALPGARILDGKFMAVQQAIGAARENAAGMAFLRAFVEEAEAPRLVAALMARHGARSLSVTPPA
jgi:polar amino acid transport system substrate-binding protein